MNCRKNSPLWKIKGGLRNLIAQNSNKGDLLGKFKQIFSKFELNKKIKDCLINTVRENLNTKYQEDDLGYTDIDRLEYLSDEIEEVDDSGFSEIEPRDTIDYEDYEDYVTDEDDYLEIENIEDDEDHLAIFLDSSKKATSLINYHEILKI
jgi:hypothetical protein